MSKSSYSGIVFLSWRYAILQMFQMFLFFGEGDSCLCFLVATILKWSPFLLASLMRCEKADDCILPLTSITKKAPAQMQVFFLVSGCMFSNHYEWLASGTVLDVG